MGVALGPAICRAQPCQPFWASPGRPAPVGRIENMVTFDDGSGAALYITGRFLNPSYPSFVESVWRWRGATWEPVGQAQLVGQGLELFVLDDGQGPGLYSMGYVEGPPTVWWFRR